MPCRAVLGLPVLGLGCVLAMMGWWFRGAVDPGMRRWNPGLRLVDALFFFPAAGLLVLHDCIPTGAALWVGLVPESFLGRAENGGRGC